MSEPEQLLPQQLLSELWVLDEPPERDPAFVLGAMEHVERRRFWLGVLALVPVVIAASAVLWALGPLIAAVARATVPDGAMLAPIAAAAVMAVFLWCWASDRLQPMDA